MSSDHRHRLRLHLDIVGPLKRQNEGNATIGNLLSLTKSLDVTSWFLNIEACWAPREYFAFLGDEMIMYCSGCLGAVGGRECLGDWWAGGAELEGLCRDRVGRVTVCWDTVTTWPGLSWR